MNKKHTTKFRAQVRRALVETPAEYKRRIQRVYGHLQGHGTEYEIITAIAYWEKKSYSEIWTEVFSA